MYTRCCGPGGSVLVTVVRLCCWLYITVTFVGISWSGQRSSVCVRSYHIVGPGPGPGIPGRTLGARSDRDNNRITLILILWKSTI